MAKHNSKNLAKLGNMLGHKLENAPIFRAPSQGMPQVKVERSPSIDVRKYYNASKHREDLAFLTRAMKTFAK